MHSIITETMSQQKSLSYGDFKLCTTFKIGYMLTYNFKQNIFILYMVPQLIHYGNFSAQELHFVCANIR